MINALRRTTMTFTLAALALPGSALGASAASTGGATPFGPPSVVSLECRSKCVSSMAARTGSLVRVKGQALARTTRVIFLGGPGPRDDKAAAPIRPRDGQLDVRVPAGASTGRLRIVDQTGSQSAPSGQALYVGERPPTGAVGAGSGGYAFPVQAKHTYGDGLGADRGHQGVDVMARCGAPLVAARGGTVKFKQTHSAAGHYLVIGADDGHDMAYMHMREPSSLDKGDKVATGQPIGFVGSTGRSTACHLHFEMWSGNAWQSGGSVLDPMPFLKAWDAEARKR